MNGLSSGAPEYRSSKSEYKLPGSPAQGLPSANQEQGDFREIFGLLKRRAPVIIGVAAAFIGYSAFSILGQENRYVGDFQLLIEPVNADNASLAAPGSELGGGRGRSALDYPTQITVLKAPELIQEILDSLKPVYPDLSFGEISGNLNINRIGETRILNVSFSSDVAAKTQAVLEEAARTYLQYSLNERQTYLRQGLQFVDQQLSELQAQVDILSDQLETFRQRNNLIDPEAQSAQMSEQISELEQRRMDLQQEMASIITSANIFLDAAGLGLALEQDPAYQQLKTEVRALDTQIAQELARFRPGNPRIQVLEQQRSNLTPLLQEREAEFLEMRLTEGAFQAEALEKQLEVVDSNLANLRSQFQRVPTLAREYGNIQRRLEITSASLTQFLETRQQLQVEAAQREIPWQVVKEPSVAVITPNVASSLMTRVLMGVALGIGAAYLLEKLDPSYHSVAELQRKTKAPILGVLPFNQQLFLDSTLGGHGQRRRKLLSRMRLWLVKTSAKFSKSMSALALSLLDEYDTSAEYEEALRVFHTNLQLLQRSQPLHSLVISSAAPGDGKTTTALNLAQTAVALGQKVLLIDASLRNPQLHRVFNLPNSVGLSSLLAQETSPRDAIQPVDSNPGLSVLTTGPIWTNNPATLLSSPSLKSVLATYEKIFDLVIIDTPAVVGLADAMLTAQHGSGLALVVRLDQTDNRLLKQALEQSQALDLPLLGLVANGDRTHNLVLQETTLETYAEESPDRLQPQSVLPQT